MQKLRGRFVVILIAVAVMFVISAVQLSTLTMTQAGELTTQSENRKVRTLSVKGSRGEITDASGIPLAYDQTSYDVQFTRDPTRNTTTDRAYYTDILTKAIDLIEQNDGTVIDTFSMARDEQGEFSFDFGVTNEEAFAAREESWRKNMFVNEKLEPDEVYRDLRNRYRIPEEYTYEQARKLLSIWQEVQLSSYRAYEPVTIAKGVSAETVAVLEARTRELDGISIAESYKRVYPKDDVAAHVVGYMGKMVDEATLKEMESLGYSQDDQIGITGIESSMESFLTGNSKERQGERTVEVNSTGKVIQEFTYVPPTSGYNVRLTLDLGMQMVAEKALAENVQSVYEQQLEKYNKDPEAYDNKESLKTRTGDTTLDKISLANSGAAVVLKVDTGEVLTLANYPSYDVNMFEGGISKEDFQALKEDPASPLFNKAIASKSIPGSIYKMVTGIAGLSEGVIDADTVINDEGPYDKYIKESYIVEGGKVPSCWIEDEYAQHAHNQTFTDAMSVSCNYYFFEVADRLGIDKLVDWSDKFGLMSKTNIELPGEEAGQVGSQDVLYNPEKSVFEQKTAIPKLVRNQILEYLKGYAEKRNVDYSDELLEETADELVKLAGEEGEALGPQIRALLSEKLEIPETITNRNDWDTEINNLLTQLKWNPTRTVRTGIGTELTAVTPIEVARYVAALVNGGNVYDAHIVDCIYDDSGNIVQEREPELWGTIDAPQEAFDLVKQGMSDVVSAEGGTSTASSEFEEWEYKDKIGGKTGTGKVSEDIDLENNAWFVAFAPKDDPEIAVVVFIPNGIGGNYAVPAAKEIIEYYFQGKEATADTTLPSSNSLLY